MSILSQTLTNLSTSIKTLMTDDKLNPIIKTNYGNDFNILYVDKEPVIENNILYLYPFAISYLNNPIEFITTDANPYIFSWTIPDNNLYYIGLTYDTTNSVFNIVISTDPISDNIELVLVIIYNNTLIYNIFNRKLEFNKSGILMPFYIYPSHDIIDSFISFIKTYNITNISLIINPSSGPGTTPDINYINFINVLKNNNIPMFGYIHTSYGTIDIDTIRSNIDTWMKLYPMIDGIFVDETSNDITYLDYYTEIRDYIKYRYNLKVINNFGLIPPNEYMSSRISDIQILYENNVYDKSKLLETDLDVYKTFMLNNFYNQNKVQKILSEKILFSNESSFRYEIDDIIVPGTLSITYTSGGVELTLTDDKNGNILDTNANIIGNVDYNTGTINLNITPDITTQVLATYNTINEYDLMDIIEDIKDFYDFIYITYDDNYNKIPYEYLKIISQVF